MKKKSPLPLIVALFTSVALSPSLLAQVPVDTAYNAPTGGALIFEEYYGNGAGRDGTGSLDIDDLNSISAESINFTLDAPTNATLDLSGILNVYTQACVIDIGFMGWSTSNTGSEFSLQFIVGSGDGGTLNYIATPNPDELFGKDDAANGLSFPQDVQNVLRLSSQATGGSNPTTAAILGLNPDSTSSSIGGAAGAGEIFVITSGSGAAQSTIDLSWIRIYTGTTDFNAPLTAIPEVSSMGYMAFASLLVLCVYRRRSIRK